MTISRQQAGLPRARLAHQRLKPPLWGTGAPVARKGLGFAVAHLRGRVGAIRESPLLGRPRRWTAGRRPARSDLSRAGPGDQQKVERGAEVSASMVARTCGRLRLARMTPSRGKFASLAF